MMSPIKTVAVVGASGNIGAPTVQLLHAAGFQITAITRPDSSSTFPDYVTVKTADYTSVPSLTAAFTSIDAVISCISYFALEQQPNLVEAAARAGVKRFIPAEYGADCLNPKTRAFPILASKIQVEDLLMSKAKQQTDDGAPMSYTLLFTGLFLDWGLQTGMIVNIKEGKATLYDGGDRIVSFTTTTTIAKAIVGCLQHPEETKNRAVYVHDIATSQNRIVELAKEITRPEVGWTDLKIADTAVLERGAEEAFQKGDYANMVGSVFRMYFGGEEYGMPFRKLDNDLFGIKEMGDVELKALIAKIVEV